MFDKLYNELSADQIKCVRDVELWRYSSFRIGGVGALGVFPRGIEQLTRALSLIRDTNADFYVIGRGSNVLFGDGRLSAVFIFTEGVSDIRADGTRICAEAGASLSSLASLAAEAELSGLEFSKGIPGSVGGGVFMNAGAYGGQLSDILVSTLAFDLRSGKVVELVEHDFSYRRSVYMKEPSLICLSAVFELSRGDGAEIKEKMRSFALFRREKQPLEYPSAGSYFKRPEGSFAGKLIEDCGLKGLSVGGAAISEKHAGFIINLGSATASDVLSLEALVVRAVYEKFGVTLEREVRVIL